MSRILSLLPWFAASAMAGTPPSDTTVTGVAHDAKGRALLEAEGGAVWTVLGLEAWPDGVSGQRVTVQGRAGEAQVLPEATQDASGAWSQGVAAGSAPDRVLRDAAWTRLPPEAGPWTVVVRSGDATWTARRTEGGMDFIGPEGVAGVIKAPGAERLFAAVGQAQAAPMAPAPAPDSLRMHTTGTAGQGGALLAPGPAADAVRAALVALGDPQ
jgi:hypothetical protein